ncbi:hypothetical protein [Sulfitobacter sp. S190]|uniref:hypothetical protein n=1 Tax=Sulfitobacter sp. S190 TaxID=2867022 RepID=UPI0021A34594|nr:hypothetical protein [Sulfitobacter sp. S190]UWR22945.1 hypothetical protein K3756_02795 [Sulfitobacter sp. S190]
MVQDKSTLAAVRDIRDRLMTQLSGGEGGHDFPTARAAMDALSLAEDAQMHPAVLEAETLLILASPKPSRRATKKLYHLFQKRSALGEIEAFETFQTSVKALGAAGVDLGGVHFVRHFGNTDHAPVWSAVAQAITQVTDLIGPAFLNSGTLLGVVREHGLLLHDDDVDLGVLLSATTAEDAAAEWARAYHLLHGAGLLDKEVKRNHGVFKLRLGQEINVDLFPAWIEEGRVWLYPHTAGTLNADQLMPLAVCPFTRQPIPRDSGAMLASNYGDGWTRPDPGYVFRWSRANRNFERFRTALTADMSVWTLQQS